MQPDIIQYLTVAVFPSPVSNLSQPGTFAGNDAIVAFARSQQVKVVIHQLNTPLWEVGASATACSAAVVLLSLVMLCSSCRSTVQRSRCAESCTSPTATETITTA